MSLNIKNRVEAAEAFNKTYVLLLIKIPKTNDKKELSAEQMFAALHGILKPKKGMFNAVHQDHIGFEIVSIKNNIYFYAWIPRDLQNFVEGQIYAQYPTATDYQAG